jgi:hypothetical protein
VLALAFRARPRPAEPVAEVTPGILTEAPQPSILAH